LGDAVVVGDVLVCELSDLLGDEVLLVLVVFYDGFLELLVKLLDLLLEWVGVALVELVEVLAQVLLVLPD
jgi:hypothetical protein